MNLSQTIADCTESSIVETWKSVEQYLSILSSNCLEQLKETFDTIGYNDEEKKDKRKIVVTKVTELFQNMIEEADSEKISIADDITNMLEQLSNLANDLQFNIKDDIAGYECLSLKVTKENLEDKISRYSQLYVNRLAEVNDLLDQQTTMCNELGKIPKILKISPLPNAEQIEEFKAYLNALILEKNARKELFKNLKAEILKKIENLDYKITINFEKEVYEKDEETFLKTDVNMINLQKFYDSLNKQEQEFNLKITELQEKVTMLWERLEEPQEVRSEFRDTCKGNIVEIYSILKAEEKKCMGKIRENIKIFIDKMRIEILSLWDQCLFSDEEKQFPYIRCDCYTEDLISLYELYIDKLKKFLSDNKEIYDLISQRDKLWKRVIELEEKAVDPARFKNRGGQLLREEKERKMLCAKLPKIEQQLVELVTHYEIKNGKPFTIKGERVADVIMNARQNYKEKQHLKLSAKKQARDNKLIMKTTPRCRLNIFTPVSAKTPNSKINRATILSKSRVTKSATVSGSVIKRASLERCKRFEKFKSKPKLDVKDYDSIDYNDFQKTIKDKTELRSTMHEEEHETSITKIVPTPNRLNVRPKSPSNFSRVLDLPFIL